MCSDHFHPWSERQAQSGFAWTWLGAALATTHLDFGLVCAPGQRYHPAVVAQAGATLAEMFPGRVWMAVGSGEALNECITGAPWPDKATRNARLGACVEVIRRLWAGNTVTRHDLIHVADASVYSRPQQPPLILAAALTPDTARWAGTWADGLITANGADRDRVRQTLGAFRTTAGPQAPAFLQVPIAFGDTDAASLAEAHMQWRHCVLPTHLLSDLATPAAFDRATEHASAEHVAHHVRVSSDIDRQIEWLHEDFRMGFDRVYLHNVVRDHARFFAACEARALPELFTDSVTSAGGT
jgi:probable non-F420 flavinoid oxidoreductase